MVVASRDVRAARYQYHLADPKLAAFLARTPLVISPQLTIQCPRSMFPCNHSPARTRTHTQRPARIARVRRIAHKHDGQCPVPAQSVVRRVCLLQVMTWDDHGSHRARTLRCFRCLVHTDLATLCALQVGRPRDRRRHTRLTQCSHLQTIQCSEPTDGGRCNVCHADR
jgi:hypothetical protein